jgi:hypothetical protein
MFFEILFLALLLAVILVRVLASIKMATEHAVTHWNQAKIVSTANTTLRRSARIQAKNIDAKNITVSPRLNARRQENKEKA